MKNKQVMALMLSATLASAPAVGALAPVTALASGTESSESAETGSSAAAQAAPTSGSAGDSVTWKVTEPSSDHPTMTISGSGDMADYYDGTSIQNTPWITSDYFIRFTTLKIESGITSIGSAAFYETKVTDVEIADTVKSIGGFAFLGCADLKSITIPSGVTSIGDEAFMDCENLEKVTIGAGVKTIGEGAFLDCTKLRDVYFNGTKAQWEKISIESGNDALTGAKLHFTNDTGFVDIDSGAYYIRALQWGLKNKITAGVSADHFAPAKTVTRGQFLTMLWRAEGSPSVKSKESFKDVSKKDYFYKAVCWALKKDVTNGTTSKTFSPADGCTRAQVVTMLWKAAGSPEPNSRRKMFSDVSQKAWYRDAVTWAYEQGITSGTSEKTFSPNAVCTRAQALYMLYEMEK